MNKGNVVEPANAPSAYMQEEVIVPQGASLRKFQGTGDHVENKSVVTWTVPAANSTARKLLRHCEKQQTPR